MQKSPFSDQFATVLAVEGTCAVRGIYLKSWGEHSPALKRLYFIRGLIALTRIG